MALTALIGADIHDGSQLYRGKALVLRDGVVSGILDPASLPADTVPNLYDGGTILPGFVDLQVNGGGGIMFNDDQSVGALKTIATAHGRTGTRAVLPTLITDTPERTLAAIEAVRQAIADQVPGIVGIHLEGPHLSVARKGAHEAALIRPMEAADLNGLLSAAERVPNVMLTVAPESVTADQIATLADAGIIICLGHTDASYQTCMAAIEAGARGVTHLFNAMSQLGNREPGLVGAALDHGGVSAGLIADGIHVHPAAIRAAMAAKRGPGQIFLVTDAMAAAGSDITQFDLNGRTIFRREGRLTLSDDTLAGADLDMPTALRVMTGSVGLDLRQAIAMATSLPATLLNDDFGFGRFEVGKPAHAIHLNEDGMQVSPI